MIYIPTPCNNTTIALFHTMIILQGPGIHQIRMSATQMQRGILAWVKQSGMSARAKQSGMLARAEQRGMSVWAKQGRISAWVKQSRRPVQVKKGWILATWAVREKAHQTQQQAQKCQILLQDECQASIYIRVRLVPVSFRHRVDTHCSSNAAGPNCTWHLSKCEPRTCSCPLKCNALHQQCLSRTFQWVPPSNSSCWSYP